MNTITITITVFFIFIFLFIIFMSDKTLNTVDNYLKDERIDILTTRIWSTTNSFPELCTQNNYDIRIPNIDKVSISFSGGGLRTFSAAIGQLRALNSMGYKNKAEYVSSVSGSSWLYGTYTYCQSNPKFTDDLLLGYSTGIADMTLEKLKTDNSLNNLFLGNVINEDIYENFIDGLVHPDLLVDLAWNYNIGKIFLERYGLDDDVVVSINRKHADDIMNRNVNFKQPLYLPDNSPFWICNTTLYFDYINQYPYAIVPMTPLYSGIPQFIYQDNNTIGGLLVENFAFGNTEVPAELPILSDCSLQTINLTLTSNIRTLRDMIGASSIGYADVLYHSKNDSLFSILPSIDIIPKYYIWGSLAPIATSSDSQCIINQGRNCLVKSGYDIKTCSLKNNKCYSNTQNQCSSNSQCTWSWNKKQCINTRINQSDLNCHHKPSLLNPLNCKCESSTTVTTPPIVVNSQKLYKQSCEIGDGGHSDNLGIISLLARGVKHIICFDNTNEILSNSENSNTCPDILNLFGLLNESCATSRKTTQVFKSSDYETYILPQFTESFNKGGPTFARVSLNVLPNHTNCIIGNYIVDILFISLQPSKRFIDQLPIEIQNEITYVKQHSLLKQGMFNNFPNFLTIYQNDNIGYYTLAQINLLSSYTEWYLNQPELKSIIQEMYKI